jgi:hypothetical protein
LNTTLGKINFIIYLLDKCENSYRRGRRDIAAELKNCSRNQIKVTWSFAVKKLIGGFFLEEFSATCGQGSSQ